MNASHIGPGHRVEGTISSGEDIVISGRVRGKIVCDATATIAPGAIVEANVTARTVLVHGAVVGNVEAADLIEVAATGQVRGDLKARQIALKPGGRVMGGIATAMDVSVPRSATRTGRSQRPPVTNYSPPASRSFDSFGTAAPSTPSYQSSSYTSSSSSFASGTSAPSSSSFGSGTSALSTTKSSYSTPTSSAASDPWSTMSTAPAPVASTSGSSAFDLKSVLDEVIGQHSSDLPTETDPAMSVVAPPAEDTSLPVLEEQRSENEPF